MTVPVERTAQLLAAARRHGHPVLFTVIAYAEGEADRLAWLAKWPSLGALAEGTPLVELDERLARRPDEPVLTTKGASAFFGTDLADRLAALGVDNVLLCGATTSGCIRASAVDSVQSGFATLVVRDCVADRAQGPHDANLFDIQAKYADVVSAEDAGAYLSAPASEVIV